MIKLRDIFIEIISYNLSKMRGFPESSVGKESTCNVGNLGLIPGLGRSPGKGKGYPLQYPGLENFMEYAVHGAAESQTHGAITKK